MINTLKKHKKKSITVASILGTLITVITFWSQVYPVICPLLPGVSQCTKLGEAAKVIGPVLDKTRLDADTMDGGL